MIEEIGQLFFIGLKGPTLSPEEADFIVKNNIGGVTLFSRNLESPDKIHKLCLDLYNLKSKMPSRLPPIIAIDMEGGRVHRLKPPFTQWPSAKKLSDLNSTSITFKFANFMGAELKSVGINLDFAPCVDVLTNPKNELIGDRSLGTDPEAVSKMVSALVRGYIKAGVIACAKHFPGHGNTIIDSHEDLPVEEVSASQLENRELIPFKKAFRARMDMVMTAHILYKNIDEKFPATLSRKIVTDLLKTQMRFKGLCISDDLDMKALTKNFSREEIPVLALKAGCDILLYCNEFDSPPLALESVRKAIKDKSLDTKELQASLSKILELKKDYFSTYRPTDFNEAKKTIGHPDHMRLAKAIKDGQIPEDMRNT